MSVYYTQPIIPIQKVQDNNFQNNGQNYNGQSSTCSLKRILVISLSVFATVIILGVVLGLIPYYQQIIKDAQNGLLQTDSKSDEIASKNLSNSTELKSPLITVVETGLKKNANIKKSLKNGKEKSEKDSKLKKIETKPDSKLKTSNDKKLKKTEVPLPVLI